MFVSKEPVRVSIDGENAIYILPKMPFGVRQRTISAMLQISAANMSQVAKGEEAREMSVNFDIAAYSLALLRNNITGWEGPAFEGVPYKPHLIEELDPDEPLVNAVLEEINRRNDMKPTEDTSPNVSGSGGSASSGATGKNK